MFGRSIWREVQSRSVLWSKPGAGNIFIIKRPPPTAALVLRVADTSGIIVDVKRREALVVGVRERRRGCLVYRKGVLVVRAGFYETRTDGVV